MIHLPAQFDPRGKRPTDFLAMVAEVPWLTRLGKPHRSDREVIRIRSWDQRPWLDSRGSMSMSAEHGAWEEILQARAGTGWTKARTYWQKVEAVVIEKAQGQVDYKEGAEPDHAPTLSVHMAAWVAGTIGTCLHLKLEIPVSALRQWVWYVRGHFPCAYEDGVEAPQYDVPGIPREEARLVIF
jgi:hypothetical protein